MRAPATIWLLVGMAAPLAWGNPAEAAADRVRGAALAQGWCSQCHALLPGHPSPNAKAPPFPAIAAEPTATPFALHVFLQTPHAAMPDYRIRSVDIDDLVAYITSLKRQEPARRN